MMSLKKKETPQLPPTKEKRKENPLPPKLQRRPVELQKKFKRLDTNDEVRSAGLTIQAEEGVFGPGITYIPLRYDDLLLLMTWGWLDSQIIAGFMVHHWLLLLVCPQHREVYILDSMRSKNKYTPHNYFIKDVMDKAIMKSNTNGGSSDSVKWHMPTVLRLHMDVRLYVRTPSWYPRQYPMDRSYSYYRYTTRHNCLQNCLEFFNQ